MFKLSSISSTYALCRAATISLKPASPTRASLQAALLGCLCISASASAAPIFYPQREEGRAAKVARADRPVTQLIITLNDTALAASSKAQSTTAKATSQALLKDNLADFTALAGEDVRFVRTLGTGAHVVALSSGRSRAQMLATAAQLARNPNVASAEPDDWVYPHAIPTDPNYAAQWHHHDPLGGVNTQAAWDITTGSRDVVVAVIDSGATNHPDLAGREILGYDFISDAAVSADGDGRDASPLDVGDFISAADKATDRFKACDLSGSSWHGTAVAGTIGAIANNGLNTVGMDWNARILSIRALGKCGGLSSDIIDAMLWSAGQTIVGVPANTTPAKIINLSLGSVNNCSIGYQTAITLLNNLGVIVVASAGNDGTPLAHSPAGCNGVISVGATGRNGGRASYSNFASTIALVAPGGDGGDFVTIGNSGGTIIGNPITTGISGTSFSAPVVSGTLSLMLALRPDLTPALARRMLQASVRPFPDSSCKLNSCGAGILDAATAVRLARDNSVAIATSVGFGDADVGIPNADLDLKVTNFTASPMSFGAPNIAGGDFSIIDNGCNIALATNASCLIRLRFSPTASGLPPLRQGSMSIVAGDGRTYTTALSGYGYARAQASETKAGSSDSPTYVAYGPDGNFWATQSTPSRIVRITEQGWTTEYPTLTAAANPFAITAGSDGNMWFTELDAGKIGRITPTGVVTEFALPTATTQPRGIVSGADGNIWFTQIGGGKIGRMTTAGVLTELTIPWAGAVGRGIAKGLDGTIWFTDSGTGSIGRISSTGVFTQFKAPWASVNMRGITVATDGTVWFVESTGNRIGRLNTAGVFTEFIPPRGGVPLDIVIAPDGAAWTGLSSASRMLRISPSGEMAEYRLPSAGSSPIGITNGPNNRLYVANSSSSINSLISFAVPGVAKADNYQDMWWGGELEDGWGMSLTQHGDRIFGALYYYDATGRATWAVLPGGTWNADSSEFTAGLFAPTSSPLNNYNTQQFNVGAAKGNAVIRFSSRTTATLTATIDGIKTVKEIVRQPSGAPNFASIPSVGDLWWVGERENGWGINIAQNQHTLFSVWYSYGLDGLPLWTVMPGGTWTGNTYTGAMYSVTGSPWVGTIYDPKRKAVTAVGTISLQFATPNTATMTYNFTAGAFAGTTQSKQIVRQGF